ncbi:MAG: hypothetical protein JJU11_14435, partial [Candidatus Sumerlaeia bacterium]|nr:hypothetical protein [Candidatus Sumerlaeia bacterium]
EVIAEGAAWSVNGGVAWHESGAEVILPSNQGDYTITFKEVEDRTTPAPLTASVIHRETTTMAALYNAPPQIPQLGISPTTPRTLDQIQAQFDVFDADGHAIVETEISWHLAETEQAQGPILSPSLTVKDQEWEVHVRVQDSHGDWSDTAIHSFTIANTLPTAPIVEIRPNNPSPSSDLAADVVVQSVDADGDLFAYDFEWWVSRDNGATWTQRIDLLFSPVVSHLLIDEGDIWRLDVVPYERDPNSKSGDQSKENRGTVGTYQVYVGDNTPPEIDITRGEGVRYPDGTVSLAIDWSWFDADGHSCIVNLSWTDLGGFGINPLATDLDAETGTLTTTAALPPDIPIHIYAVIIDEKGAMTQVTSDPVVITDIQESTLNGWFMH